MLHTGENVEKLMLHKDAVLSLKFTKNGEFMATCDKRGTIQFYQNCFTPLIKL